MDISRADRAGKLISVVCNVWNRALLHQALRAARVPLTPTQYLGLRFVILHPRACVKDIASGLQVSHSAAVKLTERLQRRGFVSRSKAAEDRRRVCLQPTETGRQAFEAVRRAHTELLARVLAEMGADADAEAERIIEWSSRFIRAALGAQEDIARVCLYCGVEHDAGCPVSEAEEALTGRPREVY
ncbi:MAG: MarR family transcriptional regulator [Armatimonadetes bacterium]|nr:MarR family transcriptional regulator [Armatimonadota bacterium]